MLTATAESETRSPAGAAAFRAERPESASPEEDHRRRKALALLRRGLAARQAASLETLDHMLDMDEATVRYGLEQLVRRGEVEILRPVGATPGGNASRDRRTCFYRLRRDSDGDYLWEQSMVFAGSAGKLHDVFETEERRPSSNVHASVFIRPVTLNPQPSYL